MSWLRTAASAYSNVCVLPEWPKYDILETNQVLSIFNKNKVSYKSSETNSRMRNDSIIHSHV